MKIVYAYVITLNFNLRNERKKNGPKEIFNLNFPPLIPVLKIMKTFA